MEIIEKEVVKDEKKEYASKGLAGTALGLGIGAAALWFLNGTHSGTGLFGNSSSNLGGAANDVALATGASYMQSEIDYISQKECEDKLALTSRLYEMEIKNMQDNYDHRQTDVQEKFQLFQNDNLNTKNLQSQVDELKTQLAVIAAREPLKDQILTMQINGVATGANAAIALEAERRANGINLETERRMCADNKIVNYVNSTFYPIEIADLTVGTTSTAKSVYNPLCPCAGGYPQSV